MCFYKAGDRVKMTEKAIARNHNTGNNKYPPTTKGVIVYDQQDSLITVKRDQRKTASSYHASFWVLDY
jgi:hypothetical protein|tara:strand:- start:155 stop:358 length:204 start_codon:yes stop_codon:yes gene_type:complete